MPGLCFEKQTLRSIWDILKCQFLRVIEFPEEAGPEVRWTGKGAQSGPPVAQLTSPEARPWTVGIWGLGARGHRRSAGQRGGDPGHCPRPSLHSPAGHEDGGRPAPGEGGQDAGWPRGRTPSPAKAHRTGGRRAREWAKLLRVGLSAGIRAPTGLFAQLRAEPPAPLSQEHSPSPREPPSALQVAPQRGRGTEALGGRPEARRSAEGSPLLTHSGARLSSHRVDAAEMQPLQGVPRGFVLTAPRGLKGDNARVRNVSSDSYGGTAGRVGIPRRGRGRARPGGGRHSVGFLLLLEQMSRIGWLIAIHTCHLAVWSYRGQGCIPQSPRGQPFPPSLGFQRGPRFPAAGPSLASLLPLLPQHISFWTLLPTSYRRPGDLTWSSWSSQRRRAVAVTGSHLLSPCVPGHWVSTWASVGWHCSSFHIYEISRGESEPSPVQLLSPRIPASGSFPMSQLFTSGI